MKRFNVFFLCAGLLVLFTNSIDKDNTGGNLSSSLLSAGCITSSAQTITVNTTPAAINASAASGGPSTTYSYQWQISLDNINFFNITGATSQNLAYGFTLPKTAYFQRKTTCGTEVAYTKSIKVTVN